MASVTALASHLLSLLQPSNTGADASSSIVVGSAEKAPVAKVDAARLAFYHFLKNLCEPGEPLSTATLDRFFRRAMASSHWVENKEALFNEVANSLQHFSNQHAEAVPLPPFASPSDLQVVRAESFRTFERIVEDWVQAHQGPTDQIKILRDAEGRRTSGDDRLIVCRLTVDRALSVHIFDRLLCLREGRLEPLNDDMAVFYTPELTIEAHRMSQIEIAPHTIARFRNDSTSGLKGLAVRGFTFQKSAAFEGGDLHRHPLIFYPLKRIEQFFVNRATDPMYIELTSLLEKASDLLAQKHPESVRFAEAAMERGRLAFEQVFVDDRFLRLLLENLERALQLERRPLSSSTMGVDIASQVGDNVSHHLGVRLKAGEEFLGGSNEPHLGDEFSEPLGPDLVELQETRIQEAESCETIAPVNRAPQGTSNRAPAGPTNRAP